MCNDRHNAAPALAQAIRKARSEVREGRCGNLINARISVANLALWRRGQSMRSWTYKEVMDARGSFARFEARMALCDDAFVRAIAWKINPLSSPWYDASAWAVFRGKRAAKRRAAA